MALLCAPLPAAAQSFPDRPIKLIVPFGAGSAVDTIARAIAAQVAEQTGQAVLVDNRTGANGIIAAEAAAKSPADGYTLFMPNDGIMAANPALHAKLPYDPVKDFAPITQLVSLNQLLLAHADVAASNLKELISLAKSQPNKLNYASYGSGSQPHLAMEMLKSQSGIEITHVPYKGIPQAVPAAIANEVQMTFSGAASSMAHLKSGRLKARAIGGKNRLALLPDVPTFAEQGFPEIPSNAWFGLFAPAGTPRDVIAKLHLEISRIVKDPEFQQREVLAKGYESVMSTPQEFASFLEADSVRNARAVKISGAKVE
jgi:tripartite-type tricarboxylate transporter receptor subunit TctC